MPKNPPIKLSQMFFEMGEIILKPEMPCQGAFLIEAGSVEVYRMVGDRKIVVAILGRGEIFGEVAMVENVPHVRYVRALEGTDCLMITNSQYQALYEKTPPIMKLFLARVVRKLRKTTDITFGKKTL
tara:strand:- start:124 stop:504 length:381 start_codon:yes stop_codon:yes gene_type:complete